MSTAATVATRELRALFLSPLAWVLLAIMQALGAWMFLVRLDGFSALQPRLAELPGAPGLTVMVVTPLLRGLAMVLMLVVPLVTMRMLSGERRDGTLTLLLAAPVPAGAVVLGKFLAAWCFFLLALGLLACTPLTLLAGGRLDAGLFLSALLGMALLSGLFAAVGLLYSSLCAQPAAAAGAAAGTLWLLWLLDWAAAPHSGAGLSLLAWLSPAPHLDAMLRGLLDTADVCYFLVLSLASLYLAARRLEAMRSWD